MRIHKISRRNFMQISCTIRSQLLPEPLSSLMQTR